MARGKSSHGGGGGGGALLACNRAIDRQNEYEKNVKNLHFRTKQIAEALSPNSKIVEVLNAESDDGANDFLSSTRSRLKAIAEGNAKRMYEIEYFVDAVKEVRTQVQNENQASAGEGEDAAAVAPDYERSIHEAMERIRRERDDDPSRVSPEDHEMSRDVRQALGEKIQKKRSRPSQGGGDDDEDDLEIVRNQTDDVHTLKCPITGMLFEDPVKNKVCHHTYDRAGLAQLLNNRKYTCPVPGCANKGLSLSQVEEDEEMKLKVKRHKVREEADKRKRELEEEDDMEEGEGGGFTVLE
mmetsp:Transcript_13676/g.29666  ORF Transcript_13676/g.29666 Transcript_13676/m.29666 type:complete len:297 (-) Transcript_13676:153-1043(-)|eukprot:CAMPEP_0172552626 /NCGR_PEP_ID=MMETSP1067-20121228/46451_1 /TAXON_ID=265564 ORGANISM="Thalassiosira punctigera, Strain Tpunct2005C2" /NCGR_SAMPLE_ID=MMETSP1067 /ASSEMBLY_ACC=CAM_ASM_000444 /LENGTH=296 /DNA_ID=CAMNT_0013340653 /DNA_START=151 /DNA_END=1041 /DNA_ORIENTATION=+